MRTLRRPRQKSFGISSGNLKHSSNIEHTFKSLLTGFDTMLIGLPVYRAKSKCWRSCELQLYLYVRFGCLVPFNGFLHLVFLCQTVLLSVNTFAFIHNKCMPFDSSKVIHVTVADFNKLHFSNVLLWSSSHCELVL
jgi:hypothetical protein